MNDEQLIFERILAEAEERAREIRDQHRGRVQKLFDGLTPEQKRLLSEYMTEHEWDTCASLSIAACDWARSGHVNGRCQ